MIIRCEKCETTYHLDQKQIEPFGSKVRCSRCGHIFWAEPPSFSFSEDPGLQKTPGVFLPFPEEGKAAVRPIQSSRKIFWTLGTIFLFILIALTARFFYIQYLHPDWSMADTWSKVFFFPVDPEGNLKLSLINVKKYYKENEKIGTLLIIEGEIKNGYPAIREKVKIRASVMKAGKKKVMSFDIFAGRILTSEELSTFSLEDISRLQ
ncbi:MAG: zinc-ribbon domain-containing protein [Deltaproteobacteria bacterium]|nr:zinc-ribbon domain-containing protein [Deltaproteobacteria bacterium]